MSVSFKGAVSGWQRLSGLEIPRSVRALVRARESGLALLGAAIGALAGLVVAAMGWGGGGRHWGLFAVPPGGRLSPPPPPAPLRAATAPPRRGALFRLCPHAPAAR